MIPGEVDENEVEEGGDAPEDQPPTSSSRKRTSSNNTTASSPSKKSKSLRLFKVLDLFVEKWEADNEKTLQQLQILQAAQPPPLPPNPTEALEQDMKTCQQLAVECGAATNSMEYFVASNLFEKAEHRIFFHNIPNNEDRLLWLQRWGTKLGLM
ncbi:hypothetical protein ACP4OV_011728 [Aristida adscensionis]